MLTPAVLENLPGPLQLPTGANPIEDWVAARQAESDLYAVYAARTGAMTGLAILADTTELDGTPTLRLGYLLAQSSWGQGYGSELVVGLVEALEASGWKGQVLARVSKCNSGSSRIC